MVEGASVTSWTSNSVHTLLQDRGFSPNSVHYLGSGHWSDCFGFADGAHDLVVRLGRHVDDFYKDRIASGWASPGLPIPKVLAIGETGDEFYVVSERARGVALELVAKWASSSTAVADLLEGLRRADVASIIGWGVWTAEYGGRSTSWRDFLLSVNRDEPSSRMHGWSSKLVQSPTAKAVFDRGYEMLDGIARDDVPRNLVHNDLYHRNVHVADGAITGVFDWGNSVIGDHLYDLAMLCFWSPWFEHLDERHVLDQLHNRWKSQRLEPANFDERFLTCMLHMALEHIAYHAFLGNEDEQIRVCHRMDEVIELSWR